MARTSRTIKRFRIKPGQHPLTPYWRRSGAASRAIQYLKQAREECRIGPLPSTYRKVCSALASAEGALRNAEGQASRRDGVDRG